MIAEHRTVATARLELGGVLQVRVGGRLAMTLSLIEQEGSEWLLYEINDKPVPALKFHKVKGPAGGGK